MNSIDLIYVITPFLTWFLVGCLKFGVNAIRSKSIDFTRIGYGGMPSNHAAIVSSTVTLIALKAGIASPLFGLAITFAFIVLMDAVSLRRQIGRQAAKINAILVSLGREQELRERVGHSFTEVLFGVLVGTLIGATMAHL